MLRLRAFAEEYAVCRLPAGAEVPAGVWRRNGLTSVSVTDRETSIVCRSVDAPAAARVEPGWRVLEVAGPLDFAEVGILAELTAALAGADVSVFAVSTFDTDYVLVGTECLESAIGALRDAGCEVAR